MEELTFIGTHARHDFGTPVRINPSEPAVRSVEDARAQEFTRQQVSNRIVREMAKHYPNLNAPVCVFLKNISAPMVLGRALALAAILGGNGELVIPSHKITAPPPAPKRRGGYRG